MKEYVLSQIIKEELCNDTPCRLGKLHDGNRNELLPIPNNISVLTLGDYEFSLQNRKGKVSVFFSKPYMSTYSAEFKLTAEQARQLIGRLTTHINEIESNER